MTLDEAISRALEVAEEQKKLYGLCPASESGLLHCDGTNDCKTLENGKNKGCLKCAEEHRQLAEWLKELKELREQTSWIPVSDQMPEEHEWIGTKQFGTTISDEVYVTFETPKGDRFTQHLSFQNGKLSRFDQQTIDAFYKGSVPISWKPLPEPCVASK